MNIVLGLVIFGIGFLIGAFFGVMIMAMAVVSGRDSRCREEMEERDGK